MSEMYAWKACRQLPAFCKEAGTRTHVGEEDRRVQERDLDGADDGLEQDLLGRLVALRNLREGLVRFVPGEGTEALGAAQEDVVARLECQGQLERYE